MSDDIDKLNEKIKAARGPEEPDTPDDEGEKKGMRAGSEFLSCVIGFGVLGFGVDSYFDTTPWGMITLFILGFVAGVYLANKTMSN